MPPDRHRDALPRRWLVILRAARAARHVREWSGFREAGRAFAFVLAGAAAETRRLALALLAAREARLDPLADRRAAERVWRDIDAIRAEAQRAPRRRRAGRRERGTSLSPVAFFEEAVRPRLSIERVYRGVEFTSRRGKHWRACCPLHGGDGRDAFSVDVEHLGWQCFSHCGTGSVLAYLAGGQEPRGEAYVDAVVRAAELAGVDPAPLGRS